MRPPCSTVVLDAQPTADVTVTVGRGYTKTDVTPNPTTLTFTADEVACSVTFLVRVRYWVASSTLTR